MIKRHIQKKLPKYVKHLKLPSNPVASLEHVYHTPGQAAAIRFFDPDSLTDLNAMREIMKAKPVRRWMDDAYISKAEYHEWAGSVSKNLYLFAVMDARITDLAALEAVKGFVFIYSEREEKFRAKRMLKLGFLKPAVREQYNLEISFAARPQPDGTLRGSGLMSSAIRQSCLQVQLLLNNKSKPQINIFGFTDPKNDDARRTLEASCFKHVGNMKYDRDSEHDTNLFLLNWRLLNKKVRQRLIDFSQQAQ